MISSSVMRWLQGPRVGRLTGPINLTLVLLLTYLLAQMTWLLLPQYAPAERGIVLPWSPASSQVDGEPLAVNGERIAGWHLFGEAALETDEPTREIPREAPETKLKLTLRGLLSAAVGGGEALAIVADDGGDEMPYRIGDDLPGGAELKEIYADRIILSRSGRFETLRLPKEEMTSAPGWERPVYDIPADDHGDGSEEMAQDAGEVLQQYRESLRENPQSLMALVRPLPVLENGQFVGFRLLPGKDRSFLGKLGLKPGDVVVGVNGVELDSAANGMQALQVLQKDSNVNLEILRGGAPMSLSFEIPQ